MATDSGRPVDDGRRGFILAAGGGLLADSIGLNW